MHSLQQGLFVRLIPLLAAVLISGAECGLPAQKFLLTLGSPHLRSTEAWEAPTIGHWLWPGAFEIPAGRNASAVQFVASGRRYVADGRSDGFAVRYGSDPGEALEVQFAGALHGAAPELEDPVPGNLSLFARTESGASATEWKRFSVSTFRNVWAGIDARFRASKGDLELDFLVAPETDPKAIRLVGRGDTHFEIDGHSGDILLVRRSQRFRLQRPRAFQSDSQGSHDVPVRAATDGSSLWFELPAYDPTRALLIDPLVATWSTLVGTNTDAMYDNAAALATDAAGNVYVGGTTQLSTVEQPADAFPTTPTSLKPVNPRSMGDTCAYGCGYVLKLSAKTHEVIYGALIYGLTVKAIAVDGLNEAVITGSSLDGNNFPGTAGVFDNDPGGEVFLSKISADGSHLVYSALFPGDSGNGLAVDAQGNAYVVGQVSTPNLPTTPGTIKPANPIGSTVNQDGFLLKVSADGSKLLYGTYLGGSGTDVANAVQVDSLGEAIVAGQTASTDFSGLTGPVAGASDAFLLKISADASQIVTGQIFGGSADDFATALAADGQNGWLLCGATTSGDFPTSEGAYQAHLLGQRNGWVRRVDVGFDSVYGSYFGGSAIDGCLGIAADAVGNAYLVGVTFSADLPITAAAFQDTTSAVSDNFLVNLRSPFYVTGHTADRESYFAELAADGRSVLYGTYLGGYETSPRFYPPLTIGTGIVAAPGGAVYVSGATEAASFPVTDGGLRSSLGGQQDGFIVAFEDSPLSITTPSLLPAAPLSLPYSITLNATGGTPPYTWSQVGFELPDGITLSADGVLAGTASNPQTEATGYQFTAKVTDSKGLAAYKSLFVNVLYPGQFLCESNNCVAALVAGQAIIYQLPTLNRAIGQVTGTVTGTLPQGITLSSSGSLAGTPTQSGVYGFTAHLQDQSGQVGTLNWLTWIAPGDTPAAVLTVKPTAVTVGQAYTLTWGASDSSGCQASGGGATGSLWAGVYPSIATTTQTATATGSFTYTVTCATGSTPIKASASLTVSASSSGGGNSGGSGGAGGGSSGGGGSGGGGSSSGGGGGILGWLELAGLLLVAMARQTAYVRRNHDSDNA
jgi:hypothetical protein